MDRRQALGVAGVTLLGASAGCLDLILGEESSYAATEATVEAAAMTDAGYEHVDTRSIEEREEIAGHTVTITNWVTEYERAIGVGGVEGAETAAFSLLTSPEVTVAGQDVNPLGEMDTAALAEMAQGGYEDFEVGNTVDSRTVQPLETSVIVDTYEGTAAGADEAGLSVLIDVGRTTHASDHLVIVGVYPALELPEIGYEPAGERERITAMIEAIVHDPEG